MNKLFLIILKQIRKLVLFVIDRRRAWKQMDLYALCSPYMYQIVMLTVYFPFFYIGLVLGYFFGGPFIWSWIDAIGASEGLTVSIGDVQPQDTVALVESNVLPSNNGLDTLPLTENNQARNTGTEEKKLPANLSKSLLEQYGVSGTEAVLYGILYSFLAVGYLYILIYGEGD